ncbi:hypothetical protein [Winogradskyella sp. A2]|uniref:hypothetical protein n=1 Tax=Winogradskyella sp. A2 TaxID=3366944 RepID=UPI00398C54A1
MKVKTIYIVFFLVATIVFGCKNDKNSINKSIIVPEGLVFNNGEKWIANTETHIGMKRIDSILKNTTYLDGKVLGEALSKETSYIIKNCDMTGIAHDQLHIVLVPILEEITYIKDVTETNRLKDKVTYIKGLVSTYFQYFKT